MTFSIIVCQFSSPLLVLSFMSLGCSWFLGLGFHHLLHPCGIVSNFTCVFCFTIVYTMCLLLFWLMQFQFLVVCIFSFLVTMNSSIFFCLLVLHSVLLVFFLLSGILFVLGGDVLALFLIIYFSISLGV